MTKLYHYSHMPQLNVTSRKLWKKVAGRGAKKRGRRLVKGKKSNMNNRKVIIFKAVNDLPMPERFFTQFKYTYEGYYENNYMGGIGGVANKNPYFGLSLNDMEFPGQCTSLVRQDQMIPAGSFHPTGNMPATCATRIAGSFNSLFQTGGQGPFYRWCKVHYADVYVTINPVLNSTSPGPVLNTASCLPLDVWMGPVIQGNPSEGGEQQQNAITEGPYTVHKTCTYSNSSQENTLHKRYRIRDILGMSKERFRNETATSFIHNTSPARDVELNVLITQAAGATTGVNSYLAFICNVTVRYHCELFNEITNSLIVTS